MFWLLFALLEAIFTDVKSYGKYGKSQGGKIYVVC